MRLTVLGKSPSWQDADGACSGYLVEDGGSCALVDCGNGVFSKLRRFRDYATVDAVVVSHLHADHFLDFAPGADILLIEATLPRPERTGMRGHLTPREAGEHARAAGVKHVVLTHISDELDELWARREGEAGFGAPVEIAKEGAVYRL